MSNEELAYLAGLFDGEGSAALYVSKTGKADLIAAITMTDENLLKWLCQLSGLGKVYKLKIREPYKPAFEWKLQHTQAIALFKSIRPWLHTKAAQVDLLLQYRMEDVKLQKEHKGGKLSLTHINYRQDMAAKVAALKRVA